jgi:FlaA1/EpsC-like NDP-sugar epimerase
MKGAAALKLLIDAIAWGLLAPVVAYGLRLELLGREFLKAALVFGAIVAPLKLYAMLRLGLHRQGWRKVSTRDAANVLRAVAVVTLLLFGLGFSLQRLIFLPRSVPLIEGLLAAGGLCGLRLLARFWHERESLLAHGTNTRRVLIVGAGEAGTMVARELLRSPASGLVPVGFLDDDPQKLRASLLGLPVFGKLDDLPRVALERRADEVLIALPSAPGAITRRVVELARAADLDFKILPRLLETLTANPLAHIREVDLEDLLRRDPVRLDVASIAGYLEDKVVLVTGAGGSIGSELVRQVARFKPRRVVLLGRGENSIFEIEQELKRKHPGLEQRSVIADTRNLGKLEGVFEEHRPQVVFHAAAHKHVPLMELNPDEAILNNVLGTKHVALLARDHGVERFVYISSDKAVNPTSVMGASKRAGELMVDLVARSCSPGQAFVSVRFGNVLGSRGSVVPTFKEQIRAGGPVTVTHPEMKRYFMTIPEASQLVLQAVGLGENRAVYVLDMGEPVRIVDLANDLIRLMGHEPGVDIEIAFTGIRPGEKLFEELLTAEEGTIASKHAKIYVARQADTPAERIEALGEQLFETARGRDAAAIRALLGSLVPTYHPAGAAVTVPRVLTPQSS